MAENGNEGQLTDADVEGHPTDADFPRGVEELASSPKADLDKRAANAGDEGHLDVPRRVRVYG